MSIPADKQEAVARALVAAFGTSDLDGPPVVLSGGLSGAALYRIRVGGIGYVLRLETAASPFGPQARGRTYVCMRAAAEAMIAPRVWHTDPDAGVTIIDLVPQVPLVEYPGEGMLIELAQTLRALHALPPFPEQVDFLEGVEGLIATFRGQALLDPAATEPVFAHFAALRAGYRPRPQDLVASHNDLNPANILYDGRRLWLIDWEVAFRADRFLDLAATANWFLDDAAGEARLLTAYLGAEPKEEQRARLRLMRLANHVYYGVIFLIGAASERPEAQLDERSLDGPALAELRHGLKRGTFDMQRCENRVTYGKARLAAALHGFQGESFARDLDLCAEPAAAA